MPAPPNLTQPAGDWINPGSVHAREPAIAAGLPVAAEDGGAIAVLRAQNFAAHSRRFPVRLLWFVVVVLVPTALAAGYYFLLAADQYVAEFRFALRTVEPARAEIGGILQGNIAPSPVGVDSYAVVQYLGSRDVIDELGKSLDLREMFSRPESDWLARLQLPVSIEELVRYWKGQVDAFYDITNGTIAVRTRAFTPDDALRLAQAILGSAEQLVNDLSARRAATLCAIRKRKCAAPRGGSSPRSPGCANFATGKASLTLARRPTPRRRWPAEFVTRSSEPTPSCLL